MFRIFIHWIRSLWKAAINYFSSNVCTYKRSIWIITWTLRKRWAHAIRTDFTLNHNSDSSFASKYTFYTESIHSLYKWKKWISKYGKERERESAANTHKNLDDEYPKSNRHTTQINDVEWKRNRRQNKNSKTERFDTLNYIFKHEILMNVHIYGTANAIFWRAFCLKWTDI